MPAHIARLTRDYQLAQVLHCPPSAWQDDSAHDLSWLLAIHGIYRELGAVDG